MKDLASATGDERDDLIRRQAAELERLQAEVAAWRKRYEKGEKRDIAFTNSESEVEPLYTALDVLQGGVPDESLPGAYPFTRGIHPTGYRGKLWTMRQFAGFGSAADTNARFKFLLEHGQTGLSTAFDFPTLMGYDSDHPRSEGEVGKTGVAISSLADMETLFDGIPLDQVSTSMTINGPP
jgi:methylmalonyl-CoA mutase N-terminal domain/subunit